jgi:hypothetical protein
VIRVNEHFMLSDLIRTFEAVLVFPVIVLAPGYVLGWILDLLAFRRRLLLTRLTLAIPFSIGICPIITYILWRFVPPTVWAFYAACTLACCIIAFRERHTTVSRAMVAALWRRGAMFLGILAAWGMLAMLALVDLQIGQRLYFPSVTYDYALRSAFIAAITRTGVPPHNPFFFANGYFPLRYHYFWLILCSFAEKLTGGSVSARQAMIAGTVWCGIGLMALVPLYLRFFQSKGPADIERRTLLGIALLGVTGLDIVPVLLIEWLTHRFMGCIEWWNDPVAAWVNSMMWVPHHVAGLIACLTGFLLLWNAPDLANYRRGIATALAAGVMFASALGTSIYVTFVFAVFLLVWMVILFLRRHRSQAVSICVSGFAALVVASPYLLELVGRGPGSPMRAGAPGGPATLLQFAVKPFRPFNWIFELGVGRQSLADLLLLPLNYSLELGFFLIVGIIQCVTLWSSKSRISENQLCGFTMAAVSLAICTFVRSSVIANNDLGWRGVMIAQFVLLIWGAELLSANEKWRTSGTPREARGEPHGLFDRWRGLIVASLLLGTAGTAYELVKIRFFAVVSDLGAAGTPNWLSPDRRLGARTYALRQLYEGLKRRTPADAIFQHNPNTNVEDFFHGMYADRQLAAEGLSCSVVFGGDASLCPTMMNEIRPMFENPTGFDSNRIDQECEGFSINVLIVKDIDPVWRDHESWVWKRKPLLANEYARAFHCGPAANGP